MKTAFARLITAVGIATLIAFAGNVAWAVPSCPAFPTFSPDFSSNQYCLSLNGFNNAVPPYTGSPSFQPPVTSEPPVSTVLRLTANQQSWAASAWYQTPQPVAGGFSTTFAFQLGSTSDYTADGFALLIQNSPAGLTALQGGGGSLGFDGMPNSIAIEFNTFYNEGIDFSGDDVTIQNCGGASPNSVSYTCSLGHYDLSDSIYLADGNVHVATVTYNPSAQSPNCGEDIPSCPMLDVILDGTDLFPGGVPFDITSIGLNGSNAFVGFTAATGGGDDDQDILSWVLSPQGGSQSGTVNQGQTTTFNFGGGFQAGSSTSGYDFTAEETDTTQTVQMQVTGIPMTQQACNTLVHGNASFGLAQCLVYQNGGGQSSDTAVMFEVTCPPNGSCGSASNPFDSTLGTDFNFTCSENSPLQCGPPPAPFSFGLPNLTSVDGLPEIGFLKGDGPDPIHPCTPYPNNTPALFQSNQIESFTLGDISGGAKGGGKGTTSCWLVTYLTGGELPSASITQPANGGVYTLNQTVNASYSCSAVNNSGVNNGVAGPYLTVSSCTGPVASGSPFSTSTPGTNTFTVTVTDSALNTSTQTVTYTVVASNNVPTSGKLCNGVYGGTFKGDITVSSGQICTFIGGGVTGNVTETGGNVAFSNASVSGNFSVNGGGTFSVSPGTTIKGNFTAQSLPTGTAQNQVCGANVGGDLTVQNNGSPVQIGSTSSCPGNAIGGNLTVQNNTAATVVDGNTVGGNLQDHNNTAPTQVFSNVVKNNLQCQNNTSITGGGNTASKKQQQCATF